MAQATLKNQKKIIANEAVIIRNQKKLLNNQVRLTLLLGNQFKILRNQKVDHQESEEDPGGSRQNAHAVVVALPPSMTSSIALV